jgi:hypothetical protein
MSQPKSFDGIPEVSWDEPQAPSSLAAMRAITAQRTDSPLFIAVDVEEIDREYWNAVERLLQQHSDFVQTVFAPTEPSH